MDKTALELENLQLKDQLSTCLGELEENRRLHERSLKIQSALYRIATAASSAQSIEEFYAGIHHIVSELMVAKSFYIFLYEARKKWRETVYFVDQAGDTAPLPGYLSPYPKNLVVYVLERGETVHLSKSDITRLALEGVIQPAGTMAEDWVGVPLKHDGQTIGLIVVQSYEQGVGYSDQDVEILTFVAQHIASSLSRARAIEETRQKNAELSIINAIQTALASKLTFQDIIELVGERIQEIFSISEVEISLFNPVTQTISFPYWSSSQGRIQAQPLPLGQGLNSIIIENQTPLLLNTEADISSLGAVVPEGLSHRKSFVGVPIVTDRSVIGAISLHDETSESAYNENDVRLLTTLASSMSVALENARLFDDIQRLLKETEQRAAELNTVNTVSQALVAEIDLDALIQLTGEQIRQIFDVDIVYLALLDRQTNMIHFPYQVGEEFTTLRYGEGMSSKILETGQPLLINQNVDEQRQALGVAALGKQALSYLAVPIIVGKEAIGVISIQDTRAEDRFTENDLHVLSTIAANVGTAIRNASLFEEIKRSKLYYEAVIFNSPAAIVTIDMQLNITGWNPAAERLFGYLADEAIGNNIDDLVASSPEIHSDAVQISHQALREQQAHLIAKRTRKDGSLVDVDIQALPMFMDGSQISFITIYHDITELQRARQEAIAANQAKSAFLANMSHELRTPLNAIIGFTRIVRRKGEGVLPLKQMENLEKVLVSADHLLNLINTVLDISKIEAGRMDVQPAHFQLRPLVDLVSATHQPLLEPGVQLETKIPPDLPSLYTDQGMLKQMLINLLSNAAKFTHQGKISLISLLEGENLLVHVKDTGIGVSAEDLSRIFEEFQQADSSTTRMYGGTGLGLSISRRLARLLGGDLTAVSQEGIGSTFTLTLPRHFGAPPGVEVASLPVITAADRQDKPLLLVIDDNPDVHHLLEQNLVDAGYRLASALNSEEGLRKAHELQPFAITLDIMMPEKDGWQVLHELKTDPHTSHIPVILLTIVDKPELGFRLGAADYLVKPLDESALLTALDRLAKSRQGLTPYRLLVVDDDPHVADMVRQLLDASVYEVQSAGDGLAALEAIQTRPPQAILLDLMMPRLDGFELLQRLRQEEAWKGIPVIVLTSRSLTAADREILKDRVSNIIEKNGLDSASLMQEIQAVLPTYQ